VNPLDRRQIKQVAAMGREIPLTRKLTGQTVASGGGADCPSLNRRRTISQESAPLNRTMPRAAAPGGVATATIVSRTSWITVMRGY
jgi:hypothetical protein